MDSQQWYLYAIAKQYKGNYKSDENDFLIWPDGSSCLREDYNEYCPWSDDYGVIYFNSPEYDQAVIDLGY